MVTQVLLLTGSILLSSANSFASENSNIEGLFNQYSAKAPAAEAAERQSYESCLRGAALELVEAFKRELPKNMEVTALEVRNDAISFSYYISDDAGSFACKGARGWFLHPPTRSTVARYDLVSKETCYASDGRQFQRISDVNQAGYHWANTFACEAGYLF